MGDMADHCLENEDFYNTIGGYYDEYDYTEYWKMRDGEVIRISDMATSHLLNTLRMLSRNGRDNEYIRAEYNKRR